MSSGAAGDQRAVAAAAAGGGGGQREDADGGRSSGGNQNQQAGEKAEVVCGVEGVSRSGPSEHACYVRFINTTNKTVDLVWLDFNGRRVKNRSLSPQTAHSLSTYRTHPWIFENADNPSERLVIKQHRVKVGFFECDRYLQALAASPEYTEEQRQTLASGQGVICVFIQLPVEDLRQLALRTVRKCVSKKEDYFCLDVPQAMQFELADMFAF